MNKLITLAILSLALMTNSAVSIAAERTITLSVDKMVCVACAFNVKKSLESVAGVTNVSVSLKERIAIVSYDDAQNWIRGRCDPAPGTIRIENPPIESGCK